MIYFCLSYEQVKTKKMIINELKKLNYSIKEIELILGNKDIKINEIAKEFDLFVKDIINISQQDEDELFGIYSYNNENHEYSVRYIKKGKSYKVEADIVYPSFDPASLD